MNPPPLIILSSQASTNLSLPILSGTPFYFIRTRSTTRSMLANYGARLHFTVAHVNTPITTTLPNIKRKRVLLLNMLSSSPYSSERETLNKLSSSSSSSSSSSQMGHHKRNDVVLGQNGVVLSSLSSNKDQKKQSCSSKFLTLPTVLTLARVASVPIFIATYYLDTWWGAVATTSIFVGAAITDWLDGYLARKMSQGTAFGAFLDPVADKLMVAATLVLLCSRPPENALYGNYPWLLPVPAIAIIGREITMSAVREWAASQDAKLLQAVAVNNLGKWKTATQMTALTIILATRDNSISSQGALATSGVGLLYISAGLAVWSLIVYMKKIWKVLLR